MKEYNSCDLQTLEAPLKVFLPSNRIHLDLQVQYHGFTVLSPHGPLSGTHKQVDITAT